MSLSWKVDDEFRFDKTTVVEHEHLAGRDLLMLAGCFVRLGVSGPFALELERDALAHYADRVDGIDDCVDALHQQVAHHKLDRHWVASVKNTSRAPPLPVGSS